MKTVRGFVLGFVVALAIGGVAGATPAIVHAVSTSHVPTPTSQRPKPTARSRSQASDHHEGAEDSKPSTGDTGLANAMDHVSANLADHPNKGLANALSHLKANQLKQDAHRAGGSGKSGKDHGSGGE